MEAAIWYLHKLNQTSYFNEMNHIPWLNQTECFEAKLFWFDRKLLWGLDATWTTSKQLICPRSSRGEVSFWLNPWSHEKQESYGKLAAAWTQSLPSDPSSDAVGPQPSRHRPTCPWRYKQSTWKVERVTVFFTNILESESLTGRLLKS